MIKNSLGKNRILSIFMIWCSLSLFPYKAIATVADGVYAYERGDYPQARSEWLPYAALGNPNALYNLGQLYRMGRGVETDYLKAREYYRRAAEKGHVGAQRNLGTLYYFGRPDKVDYGQALKWLTKAAVNGDARSQFMVGVIHFKGETGQKNYIQAYAWIMLAAENGLGKAKAALTRLEEIMTGDQMSQAKKLAPDLIFRHLSPDDAGLMVKPEETSAPNVPELANSPKVKTKEKTIPAQDKQDDEIPQPEATVTTADNFRVQLGSYRTREVAEKAQGILLKKLAPLISDHQINIEFADLGERGIYYRLQLLPFENHQQATDICSELKEKNQDCYVVKTP